MAGIAGILDTSMLSGEAQLLGRARAMAEQAPGSPARRTEVSADETTGIALAATGVTDAGDPARLTAIARSQAGRLLIAMTGVNGPFTAIRREIGRETDSGPGAALIAAAVEAIGIGRTMALAEGPLALAVWDRGERMLTIGRDRYGQELLFAAWAGSSFVFGSHLFSLLAHPGFRREIDRGALAQYLRLGHLQSPNTIFNGAVRVAPGSIVTVHAEKSGAPIEQFAVAPVRKEAEQGLAHRFTGSAEAAVDALDAGLRTALRETMHDPSAPVALFFSGGLDSTLLAATAASMGERPVIAITAGFSEAAYDESSHARAVAAHLGIEHHVLPFTADDMRQILTDYSGIFQEPFGDLAALPAIKLARAAGEFAPQVVTGDGGDELFEGASTDPFWNARRWMPGPTRALSAHALDLAASGVGRVSGMVDRYAPRRVAQYLRPTRLHKAAAVFHASGPETARGVLNADTIEPRAFIINSRPEPHSPYTDPDDWLPSDDPLERWRYMRVFGYTLDREVVKHQRAITAAGLAYSGALFHPAVAQLIWSMAPPLRDLGGESRGLMRRLIDRSVPRGLFDKKKAGFDVPFDLWLRGPLRDLGEEVLGERRLRDDGFFDPAPVRREWNQHLTGKYDRRFILFDLIAFQLWVESMRRIEAAI
jgi:asparagine synthase (glutamine-hydrolysing)